MRTAPDDTLRGDDTNVTKGMNGLTFATEDVLKVTIPRRRSVLTCTIAEMISKSYRAEIAFNETTNQAKRLLSVFYS